MCLKLEFGGAENLFGLWMQCLNYCDDGFIATSVVFLILSASSFSPGITGIRTMFRWNRGMPVPIFTAKALALA